MIEGTRMGPDDRARAAASTIPGSGALWAAVAILVADAAAALVGHPSQGLAAAALLLSPGLALIPLLPAMLRRSWLATACAVPMIGFAASSVLIITVALVGVRIDGLSVRVALAAVLVAGLLLERRSPSGEAPPRDRPRLIEAVLLGLALVAGVVLQGRVLHGFPVPGNDWAKYLLYADEIRHQGSMLIDNPYWMLGVPFREDPGVPAVYGAFLTMTDAPAAVLAHGIWVFAVVGILGMFAWARTLWGPSAGGLAGLLYAVLPMNQDILGWHGLANVGAFAILPLILLGATELLRGSMTRREAAGLGLALIALAAAHRLTFTVTVLALLLAGVVALLAGPRKAVIRSTLWTAGFALALGWGVIIHLVNRNRTFGGTQGYEAYLSSKLDLGLVTLDLTWTFAIASALAVLWALVMVRRHPALGVPLALLIVTAGLSYSWVAHLPLSYLRMAYYLPVALVPLLAVGLARLGERTRVWIGALAGVAIAAVIATSAWGRAADVRTFYAFTDPASLRGLDLVAARLRPGEVVATDRCWSFLSTWLLHTRTLPALAPEDIQPKAELSVARSAQALLDGRPAGVRLARRLGIRYILADPTCVDPRGHPIEPPLIGEPIYASNRLVVLQIPPDPRRDS
jgi:hypothetical protein